MYFYLGILIKHNQISISNIRNNPQAATPKRNWPKGARFLCLAVHMKTPSFLL